jgi:hypothetical protein
MLNNGGGPMLVFSTRLALRSDRQPDIYRLTCMYWGSPGFDAHLTITDIRRTLTPLFTLNLPAPGARG